MNRRILIAPSVLSADFSRLSDEIKTIDRAGADWVHVDVMDGHFVPNITIGPVVVKSLRKTTSLPLDVHLMIEKPWKYVNAFAEAGSDSMTLHLEACPRPKEAIREVRRCGKKVGLSIRPKTPLPRLFPYLDQVDLVLIMTVEPGFGGQKFMPEMLNKVRDLRKRIFKQKLDCRIEVDGGINLETAVLAVKAGADVLVAGNAIFASPEGSRNAIRRLKQVVMESEGGHTPAP